MASKPGPAVPNSGSDGRQRVTDLAKPVLPWKFALMNTLLAIPLRNKKFSVEGVLSKACKLTGLSDFGDEEAMPFREGLEVFLEDANAASLTPLGKTMVENALAGYLANRLRIVQLVKEHPEILDEDVEDPVVIAGLPRSGTTHLQRTLARCSAFRPLKMFEVMSPVEPGKQLEAGEKDPRLAICEEKIKQAKTLRPVFFKLHDIHADDAEEEHHLLAMTYQSITMFTMLSCPRYASWFTKCDKKPGYTILKLALQVIQWQDRTKGMPKKPFLLKTPGHLAAIPELMETFPKATLINTHRDLKPSLLSLLYLLVLKQGFVSKEIDLQAAREWVLELLIGTVREGAENCQTIDKQKVIHVLFKNYVHDNRTSIKKILERLKVKCSEEDWSGIDKYLEETNKFKEGSVLYDPAPFDLDMDEVDSKAAFYREFMEGLREVI